MDGQPWMRRKGRPIGQRTRPCEVRRCARHGEVEHALYGSGDRTPHWRCRTCIAESVTRRHHKIRRILIAEAGGCCAVCGYKQCLVALHFHHVDPAIKSFSMTAASGKGLAARREEAKKCVLVCANCHAEIECGQVPSPPPGARFRGQTSHDVAPAAPPKLCEPL